MSTGVTNRAGERERGKGTDGGSERVQEVGETDHLRSVGRQHKPVGEGRSPLDSVLQRDESRDRERGCDKLETMRARETERTEEWSRQRQRERECKRARQKIGLVGENHRGVRSHREWEIFGLSYLSSSKCLFAPDVCIKY